MLGIRLGRWRTCIGQSAAYLLLLACLFETQGRNYWDKAWATKWFYLLALLSAWVAWSLGRRVSWFLPPAFLSLVLPPLSILYRADNYFRTQGERNYLYAVLGSEMALVAGLLSVFALLLISRKHLEWIETSLFLLCAAATALTLLHRLEGRSAYEAAGNLGNSSMLGCLIATTFPYWVRAAFRFPLNERPKWLRIVFCLPPLVAIFMTQTTTPIFVLTAVALSPFLLKRKAWSWATAGVAALLLAGFWMKGASFLNDDGRISTWRLAIKAWRLEASPWLGFGPGTFKILFPAFQDKYTNIPWEHGHPHHNYFLWAHNDFIEVLFEQGLIGLGAWCALFLAVLKRSLGNPTLLAALSAFAVMAFFNYPMNWAPTAYVALALGALSFLQVAA